LKEAYKTIAGDHFAPKMEISFIDGDRRETLSYEKVTWNIGGEDKGLRYGENPGQEAALYKLVNGNLVLGEVETIQAHCVYENDDFEYEYGLDPKLSHKPAKGEKGEFVGAYAVFRTKSGGYGFDYMSSYEIEQHAAKYSQSYGKGYSPWKTNFEEMAKKTVIKRVLKYAPLKTDFVKAVAQDSTIKQELAADMFEVSDVSYVETDITEVEPAEETAENV
jgi:recombinational DNA repair protein RecT